MPSPPPPPPSGTVYETDEEILQALRTGTPPATPAKPRPSGVIPNPGAAPLQPPVGSPGPIVIPQKSSGSVRTVEPFHPINRPPIAHLVVSDDGKTEGEIIRIRSDRFIIGRTEGDLLIPHDPLISGRHVDITRQLTGGRIRWVVTDLNSMNGLFVRVSRAALSDQSEFLVGAGRYRLEAPESVTVDHMPEGERGSTKGWASEKSPVSPPALVELVAGGIGNRYVLSRSEYWIGADPNCAICRPDDRFCEAWHVRIYRDQGGWFAEHKKTLNGLWLRVPQIASEKGCQFQIGEQRFRLVAEA
jgi:hypothetical protein